MSKKKLLTTEEAKEATAMINSGMSWKKVAGYFGVNKPGLLKSVGLWMTGERKLKDGREYKMGRGRLIIKGEGAFQVKELPAK